MEPPLTDAETIQRSIERPATFALLYERHSSRVLRFVARRVGPELAEDLAAEVFVRAFRGRSCGTRRSSSTEAHGMECGSTTRSSGAGDWWAT